MPHSQQGSLGMARWQRVWSRLWGSASPAVPEPGAWQQLLSQACPVACQALSPAPALIQGARILQIWAVLERKWTRSWHSGRSLFDRRPRGRGAPALAGTRCQLFPAPSGSSQHLQGPLAVESPARSDSLPCWRWHRECSALPGGLRAGGELCPGTNLLLTAVGVDGTSIRQGVPIAAKSPHPALSSPGGGCRMDSPFPCAWRKMKLQPWAAVMPQSFSTGIWTEALQTHFLPRGRPLMGTGLARGHPAQLPNIRSSVAPRHSRGPWCPPCADPVCSFLMSSKSRMDPGPFSSLGHLGGSRRGWVWLRWWGRKKIPFWDEHKSCCQHRESEPPSGALPALHPFAGCS